jgi:hypothetical protein
LAEGDLSDFAVENTPTKPAKTSLHGMTASNQKKTATKWNASIRKIF